MSIKNNIKILITTNIRYSPVTIPILTSELLELGFDKSEIMIVEGGHTSREVGEFSGIHKVKAPQNSFDLTGLIDISDYDDHPESKYWFNLQDTCKPGPQFYKLLDGFDDNDEDVIALRPVPAMNMGLYKTSYIKKCKEILSKCVNIDTTEKGLKDAKWRSFGYEDIISHSNVSNCPVYGTHTSNVPDPYCEWYNGALRSMEYYPQLDFYKAKGNWGNTFGDSVVISL